MGIVKRLKDRIDDYWEEKHAKEKTTSKKKKFKKEKFKKNEKKYKDQYDRIKGKK